MFTQLLTPPTPLSYFWKQMQSSSSSSPHALNRAQITLSAINLNLSLALCGNGCCIIHSEKSGAWPSPWQHHHLPQPIVPKYTGGRTGPFWGARDGDKGKRECVRCKQTRGWWGSLLTPSRYVHAKAINPEIKSSQPPWTMEKKPISMDPNDTLCKSRPRFHLVVIVALPSNIELCGTIFSDKQFHPRSNRKH